MEWSLLHLKQCIEAKANDSGGYTTLRSDNILDVVQVLLMDSYTGVVVVS